MGREKSDGRVGPEGLRKQVPIVRTRGGKATTDIGSAQRPGLRDETAERPKSSITPGPAARTTKGNSEVIMEQVASMANLLEAFRRVEENRGAPGPDGRTVDDVRRSLPTELSRMQHALLEGTYEPGSIRRVWIPKSGGGQRGLGIPNVIDRVVQQALLQRMVPKYEPTFHRSSHGFRPGRSCHTAVAEAKAYVAEGRTWMVDIDLEKFFDRVNHQRLLAKLRETIRDERILRLISRMLRAHVVMPDGVIAMTEEGTPQGGPLSPLLSNIVLDELDRELEERGHRFVRYADDLSIYVRSESAGRRVFESVARFLGKRLRLAVNRDKSAISRPRGRHILGFSIRPNVAKRRVELDLSDRTKRRLRDRIAALTPRTWGQSLRSCIERINTYLRGWAEYFGVAFWAGGTARYADGHIRRRLRAILLEQWKGTKTIRANLIRLGAEPEVVRTGRSSGKWERTNHRGVRFGLRNEWFARWGLLSLDTLCAARLLRGLPLPEKSP
jgi:RNA-directed DNA polymerase